MAKASTARILNASLSGLGSRALAPLGYSLGVARMIYLALRAAVFDQAQGWRTVLNVVSAQIYFSGVQALPLISVLGLATGSIVILQASFSLSRLGGVVMLGDLMIAIIVRELAPLLTALIVIARSGTAVTSELGHMRVSREIEALESMGIHPLSYVVFPRLVGGTLSVICLSIYFAMVACLGGFLVTSLLLDVPLSFYADVLARALGSADAGLFLLKSAFGGAMIFTIACFQGLNVGHAPHEVPQATTRAVVNSVIYVVIFNLSATLAFYVVRLSSRGGGW